jgi:hypothetical protein
MKDPTSPEEILQADTHSAAAAAESVMESTEIEPEQGRPLSGGEAIKDTTASAAQATDDKLQQQQLAESKDQHEDEEATTTPAGTSADVKLLQQQGADNKDQHEDDEVMSTPSGADKAATENDKETKGGTGCDLGACPVQEYYNKWIQEVHQNWGQRGRRILLVQLADQSRDDSSQGLRRHSDIVAVDTEYCKLSIEGDVPSHSLVVLQGAALVKLLLGANLE